MGTWDRWSSARRRYQRAHRGEVAWDRRAYIVPGGKTPTQARRAQAQVLASIDAELGQADFLPDVARQELLQALLALPC